jgi:MFS family permease
LSTDRRPLAALLAANAISVTGSSLTLLAVPWFVLQTTGSAGKAGFVGFCTVLPVVVSTVVGGPLVDRIGRRRVSICSDLACAVAVTAVPLLQSAGLLRFWLLCALMAVTGLCQAPGEIARGVLVPALAQRAAVPLARAAAFYDSASRCAGMVGAAVGGVLIAVLGADQVLWLDGASFAASALLIAGGLRGPQPKTERPRTYWRASREGYRHVLASPLLLGICLVALVVQALDQGWSAVLLPVDVRAKLGGAPALGLVEALFSAGALAGALLYAAVGSRFRRWPVYALALLIVGAPRFVVAATTHTVTPLAVMMAVEGLACGVLNPIIATVLYEQVPDRLRSRVLSATTSAALLIAPLGGLAAGFLVDSVGLAAALLLVGGVYLVATLCPVVLPAWRQLD